MAVYVYSKVCTYLLHMLANIVRWIVVRVRRKRIFETFETFRLPHYRVCLLLRKKSAVVSPNYIFDILEFFVLNQSPREKKCGNSVDPIYLHPRCLFFPSFLKVTSGGETNLSAVN